MKYSNRYVYAELRFKKRKWNTQPTVPDDERCQAVTQKGTPCKRRAQTWGFWPCLRYCDQHCEKIHGGYTYHKPPPPVPRSRTSTSTALPDDPAEWLASLGGTIDG